MIIIKTKLNLSKATYDRNCKYYTVFQEGKQLYAVCCTWEKLYCFELDLPIFYFQINKDLNPL